MAFPPPYMFTQYPATPGDYQTSAGLQYGQLKEQRRASMEHEAMVRAKEAARQRELLEAQQWEALQQMFKASEDKNYNALGFYANRAQSLGLQVDIGGQPTDQATGGLPVSPGAIAAGGAPGQQPGLPMSPGAIRPEPGGIEDIAKMDQARDTKDYYTEEVARPDAARAALVQRAQKQEPMGLKAMREATGTDYYGQVESAMARGDEKALGKAFGRDVEKVAEGVTLGEEELSADPQTALSQMRAAQARGEAAQRTQKELDATFQAEAGDLIQRAAREKDPAKSAELLGQSKAVLFHPATALQQGMKLDEAGDKHGAVAAYLEAAAAGAKKGDDLWNDSVSQAQQRVAHLGPPATVMQPGQIGAPVEDDMIAKGWSVRGFRGPHTSFNFSPEGMQQSRHDRIKGAMAPTIAMAYANNPALGRIAEKSEAFGHLALNYGATPKEAIEAAHAQYNKEADRWQRMESSRLQSMARAEARGDKLLMEKWDVKDKYVNQFKMRNKIPQVVSQMEKMQLMRSRLREAGPKERGSVIRMILHETQKGVLTDADVNQTIGSGSLWDKFTDALAMAASGEVTDKTMKELESLVGTMYTYNRDFVLNRVKTSLPMFQRDPSIQQLLGDDLEASSGDMLYDMSGGLIDKRMPHPEGEGALMQRTERRSESYRTSGPATPQPGDDDLAAVGLE